MFCKLTWIYGILLFIFEFIIYSCVYCVIVYVFCSMPIVRRGCWEILDKLQIFVACFFTYFSFASLDRIFSFFDPSPDEILCVTNISMQTEELICFWIFDESEDNILFNYWFVWSGYVFFSDEARDRNPTPSPSPAERGIVLIQNHIKQKLMVTIFWICRKKFSDLVFVYS